MRDGGLIIRRSPPRSHRAFAVHRQRREIHATRPCLESETPPRANVAFSSRCRREQRIENRRRPRSAQSVENRGIPILQKIGPEPAVSIANALIQTRSSAALLNDFHDSSRATAFARSLWKTRGHPVDVI